MTVDICSVWAYCEIKDSGYVGLRQSQYLYIFANASGPMTHREATEATQNEFMIRLPERNGRIAELEEMGFLEKVDMIECPITKKTVNRWGYTGRKRPLPKETVQVECEKCCGKGYYNKDIYVKQEEKQMDLF